jgi:hypothetical protein
MKIILQGLTPRDRLNGTKINCSHCKGQFEITVEDNPKFNSDQREGSYWSITCPTANCGHTLTANA